MIDLLLYLWRILCTQTCFFVGVIYPALASVKATVQEDLAAYEQWMTYWVVASVLSLLDPLISSASSLVPFFMELKVILLLWLTLPHYQGAAHIYNALIHPWFSHYEIAIDQHLDKANEKARGHVRRATSHVVGEGSAGLGASLNSLSSLAVLTTLASDNTAHIAAFSSDPTPEVTGFTQPLHCVADNTLEPKSGDAALLTDASHKVLKVE